MGVDAKSIARDCGESQELVLMTLSRFADRKLFVEKIKPNNYKDVRWVPLTYEIKPEDDNKNILQSAGDALSPLSPKQRKIYEMLVSLHEKHKKDQGYAGILAKQIADAIGEAENYTNASLSRLARFNKVPLSSVVVANKTFWQPINSGKENALPPRQDSIYRKLKEIETSGPQTTELIAQACCIDIKIVRKELFQLSKKGLVIEGSKDGKKKTWMTLPSLIGD